MQETVFKKIIVVCEYALYVEARTKNNWVQFWGNMNGETAGEKYRNGRKINRTKGTYLCSIQ